MTKCALIVQLEIPQIPNNLLSPSAQIGQLFGIFFERIPHRMSIVHIPRQAAKPSQGSQLRNIPDPSHDFNSSFIAGICRSG